MDALVTTLIEQAAAWLQGFVDGLGMRSLWLMCSMPGSRVVVLSRTAIWWGKPHPTAPQHASRFAFRSVR